MGAGDRSTAGDAARRAAVDLGARAEDFVAQALRAAGAEVLARRYRARGGELDLVALRGSALRFVEVKARTGPDDGLQSITAAKRRRLIAAAEGFLDAHEVAADDMGFLIALVDTREEIWSIRWIDDAFDA